MTETMKDGGGRLGNRWRMAAWASAALLLLLPYFAMQVSDQVAWGILDFAIFGAMLVSVGVAFELAARKTGCATVRAAVGVALAAAFILIGVTGAVGVIGTEHDDANLMLGGVLAVGIIGVTMARFQPLGMARAMFATALAQMLAAVIALFAGLGSAGPIWPLDILMLTGFFTVLWLMSAWLFRKSARDQTSTSGASENQDR